MYAQKLDYRITSLSMKVADLAIDLSAETILIRVQNQGKLRIFPHLNNSYRIELDEDMRPTSYQRMIHQGELRDSVFTSFDENHAIMHQESVGKSLRYEISAEARDIFSFLFAVSQNPNPCKNYILDGDGRPWQAQVSPGVRQRIRTAMGTMFARKHDIRMVPLSQTKAPYVDMITHNFFDENIKLSLWVSDNGIPLKAQLRKNMIGMNWEIIGIR